jgi:hypothetical protein
MKTKDMTKKIPKTGVEQTEGKKRSYPYLYPIGDLIQRGWRLPCVHQPKKLLEKLPNSRKFP